MGTELLDNRGLICGFRLQPQGPAVSIAIGDVDPSAPPPAPLWLHFNANDTRARDWLAGCAWLRPDGREMLLSKHHNIRLEASGTGTGLGGVLADVYADEPESYGVFHLYADDICLITARRHPLTSVSQLREDLVGGMSFLSSTDMLHRLLDHITETFDRSVLDYANRIDDAEDAVYAGDIAQPNLGQYRREMARLRRQVFANRHALLQVSQEIPAERETPAGRELHRIAAALTLTGQDLELAEERARLVNEEIDSRLAARTNRNLYFISLAASVFLPITVISGIFGMNVGGLPWVDDPAGFKWTLACMAAAIIIAFALIRWRRML